jgi:hypothetical protein
MQLGPISVTWRKPKATNSSSADGENWLIDQTPTGEEESALFNRPALLTSTRDTRDLLENADYHGDILGKRRFGYFAIKVGKLWAITLVLVVFMQGWGILQLEPEEFIAVVSTTTASVFGLVYVVGRYLFGSKAYESKTKAIDSVAPNSN